MNVYKINCNKEVFFLWVIWKVGKYVKYLFNFKCGIKFILEISDLKVDINLNIMIFGFYYKIMKNIVLILKYNCFYFIYSV